MASVGYYTPTCVYFGRGAEDETAKILKKNGAHKVLLHYGGGSVVRSGLLPKIKDLLKKEGLEFIELGGVKPNPRLTLAREGIRLYREEKCNYILAVGGGSAIDSAKCISYGVQYDGDVWDFYSSKAVPSSSAPLGVILTLSATGSEMSDSSVITNDEVFPNDKVGCNNDLGRPRFAILNPALTFTVSKYQTASGSTDIMMHTLERFFHSGEKFDFTDQNAITLLKTVWKYTLRALENPEDYEARSNLMWAGSVSHNGFTAAGNPTKGDWSCHRLEHELSALYDVAHGAGLAAIWGSWARHVCHTDYSRFAYLGRQMFGFDEKDDKKACERTIEGFEDIFRSFGMPTGLHELGLNLTKEEIDALSLKASWNKTRVLGDFRKLYHDDMQAVFEEADKR